MEKTIGEIIAQKRKEKKLTQDELAERMGVSAQAVSKWENGRAKPTTDILRKLSALWKKTVMVSDMSRTSTNCRKKNF